MLFFMFTHNSSLLFKIIPYAVPFACYSAFFIPQYNWIIVAVIPGTQRKEIVMNRIVGVMLLVVLFGSRAEAQDHRMHAAFIYHFTRYINWPVDMRSGEFVIGLVGNPSAVASIEQMVKTKKKTREQELVIKKFSSTGEISECHILFVSAGMEGTMSTLLQQTNRNNTLVITEKDGMALNGSSINFVSRNGKLRFEINEGAINEAGLQISSKLKALGIIVG